MDPKLLQIVQSAIEKTRSGQLQWRPINSDGSSYSVSLGRNTLSISEMDDSPSTYLVLILNEAFHEI
ncbi:MAG: hypothetical protein ACRCZF_07890, partial [Gemmataceae bacterium]